MNAFGVADGVELGGVVADGLGVRIGAYVAAGHGGIGFEEELEVVAVGPVHLRGALGILDDRGG